MKLGSKADTAAMVVGIGGLILTGLAMNLVPDAVAPLVMWAGVVGSPLAAIWARGLVPLD